MNLLQMRILVFILGLGSLCSPCFGVVTLVDFLDTLQTKHPFFTQQQLQIKINYFAIQETLGPFDWQLSIEPIYQQQDLLKTSAFSPTKRTATSLGTNLQKTFFRSGAQLSLFSNIDHTSQRIAPIQIGETNLSSGLSDFYQSDIGIQYSLPLRQNWRGFLTQLPYRRQQMKNNMLMLEVTEQTEQFFLVFVNHYLDWVSAYQHKILAQEQEKIFQQQYRQTKRKYKKNIVAKVDLLIAEDALINIQQEVQSSASLFNAKSAELSMVLQSPDFTDDIPSFNLFEVNVDIPTANPRYYLEALRAIHQLQENQLHLVLDADELDEKLKSTISLQLKASLVGGGSSSKDLSTLNKKQVYTGFLYQRPIENTGLLQRQHALQEQQSMIAHNIQEVALHYEGRIAFLLTRMQGIKNVMALQTRQLTLAQSRVSEEVRRYKRSLSSLNDVIQARQHLQHTKKRNMGTVTEFFRVYYQFLEVSDQLLVVNKI